MERRRRRRRGRRHVPDGHQQQATKTDLCFLGQKGGEGREGGKARSRRSGRRRRKWSKKSFGLELAERARGRESLGDCSLAAHSPPLSLLPRLRSDFDELNFNIPCSLAHSSARLSVPSPLSAHLLLSPDLPPFQFPSRRSPSDKISNT